MNRGWRGHHINVVPMFAGVLGAVLLVGTLVGQGGHATGDSDADMSGMSMSMPGMSMGGGSGSGGASDMDPNMPGMDPNMPGMPPMAATPNDSGGTSSDTVTLRPGAAKQAGGMMVRLVKVGDGTATVQMDSQTAKVRSGAQKKFRDGMTVRVVRVAHGKATLKVSRPS
jgi:hypothetical protein